MATGLLKYLDAEIVHGFTGVTTHGGATFDVVEASIKAGKGTQVVESHAVTPGTHFAYGLLTDVVTIANGASVWVSMLWKPILWGGDNGTFLRMQVAGVSIFQLYMYLTNVFKIYTDNDAGGWSSDDSAANAFTMGQEHRLVIDHRREAVGVGDGYTRVYIDGALVCATSGVSNSTRNNGLVTVYVGSRWGAAGWAEWHSYFDEILVGHTQQDVDPYRQYAIGSTQACMQSPILAGFIGNPLRERK